jgi:5-methylcytosine-specific restriction endonuclease McrA
MLKEATKKLKKLVKKRDGNHCCICSKDKRLHIHHKDSNIKNNSIDNLMTVCVLCHKAIHSVFPTGKKKKSMEQAKKRREEIHILIENGKTYREVGELYEISPQRVHGIIKKHLELDECEYEI